MTQLHLNEARELVVATNTHEANKYIELGWRLLCVAPGQDETKYPLTHYSLGWFGENAPDYPYRGDVI